MQSRPSSALQFTDREDLREELRIVYDQEAQLLPGPRQSLVERGNGGAPRPVGAEMERFIIVKAVIQDHQDAVVLTADKVLGPQNSAPAGSVQQDVPFFQIIVRQELLLPAVPGVQDIDTVIIDMAGPVLAMTASASSMGGIWPRMLCGS